MNAVSYTHLDVYKRQIGACAGSTGGGMKVSRVMIAFKEIKKEMASVIHPRSVKAVSYTHLDVYKRQEGSNRCL